MTENNEQNKFEIPETGKPGFSDVTAERLGDDTIMICWEAESYDRKIIIQASDSPFHFNEDTPVGEILNGSCIEMIGLPKDTRHFFKLRDEENHEIMVAERLHPFSNVGNFRDLGGYETVDGKFVKWGRVYRSGHLSRIDDEDRKNLKKMGITMVCDFRTPAEIEKQPDALPEDGSIKYQNLPIVHGEFDPAAAMESLRKGDLSWLTEDFIVSRALLRLDEFKDVWAQFFRTLVKEENRPLVLHCTAGKDRAGTCAALLLLSIGVPEETVLFDYNLSNVYNAKVVKMIFERLAKTGVDTEKAAPYFTAPKEAMTAMFDHLRKTYGGIEGYLIEYAGLEHEILESLRNSLLE